MDNDWTTYHLDNGVIVKCGPLKVTWREDGDQMVCRVDCETRVTVPGMEVSVPKDQFGVLPAP